MSFPRLHSALTGALLLALTAGVATLAYARWARPLVEADRALAAGNTRQALDRYAAAERRFSRFRLTKYVFAAGYARAVRNQLALLYHAGDYGAVLEKAGNAPAGAAPHFWMGAALFERAMAERAPDARLAWMARADEEFRQALAAAPDDWDTKYNYEVVARLAAELRRQPRKAPRSQMQLLRPQPRQSQPVRRVG